MQRLHPLLPLHPGEQPPLSPHCHMPGTPWGQQTSASSSQPLSNPWPLVWVRQGDSDTYRHVTRATRVPTHPPTHQDTQAAAGRQGLSPATTLGWTRVPCLLRATGASGHRSRRPRTPLPTSPRRDGTRRSSDRGERGGEGMLGARTALQEGWGNGRGE